MVRSITKKDKDWKVAGASIYYIDMKAKGSPLYFGRIISINAFEKTAECELICQHREYSQKPQILTLPIDIIRKNQ